MGSARGGELGRVGGSLKSGQRFQSHAFFWLPYILIHREMCNWENMKPDYLGR